MKYRLFILCLGLTCLARGSFAQSGRRSTPAASPSPTSNPTVVANETKEPVARPASIIIAGKTASNGGGYHSTDVRDAYNEVKILCDLFRLPWKPLKGGTMTAEQARDRARKETDAYVLWLGINVKLDESSVESIMQGVFLDHVDYVLFRPQTGEIEYRDTVDPKKIVQRNENGTRLPPLTQGRSHTIHGDLRRCVSEIVRVVRGRL